MSTGDAASNVSVYGDYTSSHVLNKGDVVEIILNNNDAGKHPFHLHGHEFQAVYRAPQGAGFYSGNEQDKFAARPMRRDTFMVNPNGNFVLRFVADNPGESPQITPIVVLVTDMKYRHLALPLPH